MNLIERIVKLEKSVAKLLARSFMYYAKSTWTPTYTGGTTAGATTYSLQDGKYIRIGTLVVFSGAIAWTAATGTGDARISLPFTPTNRGSAAISVDGVTFANSAPQTVVTGVQYFIMTSPLTNAARATVQMEAAGRVDFSGVIFV